MMMLRSRGRSLLAFASACVLLAPGAVAGSARAAAAACTWSVVASPNGSTVSNRLYAVSADSSTDAWTVGTYNLSSGLQLPLTEHWNGKAWSAVTAARYETADNGLLGVSALSPAGAWAVGYYYNIGLQENEPLIESWNGKAWSVVRSPLVNSKFGGQLYAVASLSATDAWAVGWINTSNNGNTLGLIEHWNGASWSIVPSPSHGTIETLLEGIAVVNADDIWVGGIYAPSQVGFDQTLAEHWNGKAWTLVATPNANTSSNNFNAIAAVSTSSVFATGDFYSPPYNTFRTLSGHWNGSAWSLLPAANAGKYQTDLAGIAAVSADEVVSVGQYVIGSAHHTFAMVWNGKGWVALATPNVAGAPGTFFDAASRIPGTADAWAAGGTEDASGNSVDTLIERYHC
jgi:hypothetical protein